MISISEMARFERVREIVNLTNAQCAEFESSNFRIDGGTIMVKNLNDHSIRKYDYVFTIYGTLNVLDPAHQIYDKTPLCEELDEMILGQFRASQQGLAAVCSLG